MFSTKKLIEAFCFVVLVDKNDLTAVLDHAMARVAEKGKNGLMGVTFEQATKFWSHVDAVFDPGFYQGQLLIRSESESVDDLVKISLVSKYTR